MSYCRKNGEDSGVYVFGSSTALECCGCSLFKNSAVFRSYSRMIAHLNEHVKNGDKVPAQAFARLRQEKDQHKDRYEYGKGRLPKNVRKTKNEVLEAQLWRETNNLRKHVSSELLKIFRAVYGRKPVNLEIAGLAKLADVQLDLYIGAI